MSEQQEEKVVAPVEAGAGRTLEDERLAAAEAVCVDAETLLGESVLARWQFNEARDRMRANLSRWKATIRAQLHHHHAQLVRKR